MPELDKKNKLILIRKKNNSGTPGGTRMSSLAEDAQKTLKEQKDFLENFKT